MKECKRCGHKKTWSGDDIKCPFQNSDKFGDNWNCGVIGEIRNICEHAEEGVDYRLHYQYCEDQKYVTIKTDCIENDEIDLGLCLFVTWYKSRGRTDAMWILDEQNPPRKPTYQELELIIKYYAIH
jgi:hypothetical protein